MDKIVSRKSFLHLAIAILVAFALSACGALADKSPDIELSTASVSTGTKYAFARSYGAEANMIFTKITSSTTYNRAYWTYWLEINNYQGAYTSIVELYTVNGWQRKLAVAKNGYKRLSLSDSGIPRTGTFTYRFCIQNGTDTNPIWKRCASSQSFKFY